MNRERGSISIVALVIGGALFGAAGLVIDGGAAVTAAAHASDIAQDAARAGAIAGGIPRADGGVVLDEERARSAATAWLATQGIDPASAEIIMAPGLIKVTVHQRRQTNLLRLVGVSELDVSGDGAARPAAGINKEGT
jgi:Flp pilus assembly protein TadG